MRRRSRLGLSLIEVVIALAVLAIAILALVQLQTSSLQSTSRASDLRTATQIVEAELEWQRQLVVSEVENLPCSTFFPPPFECTVTIIPCSPVGNSFECAAGLADPIAHRITASVTGRSLEFEQSVISTGSRFIAGVRSGGVGGGGDGDGTGTVPPNGDDDSGDDDDTGAPIVDPGTGSKGKGGGKGGNP